MFFSLILVRTYSQSSRSILSVQILKSHVDGLFEIEHSRASAEHFFLFVRRKPTAFHVVETVLGNGNLQYVPRYTILVEAKIRITSIIVGLITCNNF